MLNQDFRSKNKCQCEKIRKINHEGGATCEVICVAFFNFSAKVILFGQKAKYKESDTFHQRGSHRAGPKAERISFLLFFGRHGEFYLHGSVKLTR